MIQFLGWYIFITILGWLAFPIAYRLLPNLRGRGFAFTRPLGLLLWGFVFYLLASLRVLQNDTGGVLLALVPLVGASLWILSQQRAEIGAWLKDNRSLVFASEILFLVGFAFLAFIRAADPALVGTEKPMEMAFINGILRSPVFPPNDPWLSGYAISYYYFGYVMVAMLTRITGADPAMAFNLAISLWYGMIALGAYGIVHALLAAFKARRSEKNEERSRSVVGWPLLAPVFLLVIGNLQGFLELLFSRGVFWKQEANGTWTSSFWHWLNIQEMCQTPYPPFGWIADRPGIWWWRASRILHDLDVAGFMRQAAGETCVVGREIIDEIPSFTFFLADLHPHVLAMPFALLAIALAFNLYLKPRRQVVGGVGVLEGFSNWTRGEPVKWRSLEMAQWLGRVDFWMLAVALGGLAFLNTWDFPIYVGLAASAYTLARYEQAGWSRQRVVEFIELGLLLGISGILLYLPFYAGFASQAGGFLPSVIFFTRGAHFWVYFGVLLIPLSAWLIYQYAEKGSMARFLKGLRFAATVMAALWLVSFFAGWIFSNLDLWGSLLASSGTSPRLADNLILAGSEFNELQGENSSFGLVTFAFLQRLAAPGAWLSLLVIFGAVWGMISRRPCDEPENGPQEPPQSVQDGGSPDAFVLLMALVGLALVITPEFFYLRDQFGWRMNTIFKFYFQAWILWSLAAAYGSAVLWQRLKGARLGIFAVVWSIVLLMGLVYPAYLLNARLQGVSSRQLNLNGIAYLEQNAPDEYNAIQFLRSAPFGYIVEAVGGSYQDQFERISTHTGLPTLLGWPGHEGQWRGGGEEMGSRENDIRRLYETSNWDEAAQIITQYDIRYIYISTHERSTYRVNELKFEQFLKPIFNQGEVVIYEAP